MTPSRLQDAYEAVNAERIVNPQRTNEDALIDAGIDPEEWRSIVSGMLGMFVSGMPLSNSFLRVFRIGVKFGERLAADIDADAGLDP